MTIFKKINFTLLFVFFALSTRVFAAGPSAELIRQSDVIMYDGKKLTHYFKQEIQINNREGDKYGEISILYSEMEKLSDLEAAIYDRTGRLVRKLTKNDIVNRSAYLSSTYYSDILVKEFTLRHNTYPYRIEYSYTMQEKQFVGLAGWEPVLDYDIPTRSATLSIHVPTDLQIAFKSINLEEAEFSNNGSTDIYRWTTNFGGLDSPEYFAPSMEAYFPAVLAMPGEFLFEKPGKADTWINYGDWVFALFKDANDLPETSRREFRSLTKPYEIERDKIKMLYHKVQDETRYVNISLKTGGMKPHPASYVDSKKYGDCKALSNYFKSALESIGVKSYLALVKSGEDNEKIYEDFPFPQFNHVIVMVPQEKDTLWLDCTGKTAFDYVSVFLQDHRALIIDEGNSHFVTITGQTNKDVLNERVGDFNAGLFKKTVAEYNTVYRGYYYEYLFEYSRELSDNLKQRMIRNNFVSPGFDPIEFKLTSPDRDSAFICLNMKASSETMTREYGDELYVNIPGCYIPDLEKPQDRFYPVWIPYPEANSRELYFEIPGGYEINMMPEAMVIESRFGRYTVECSTDLEKIKIQKRFDLNRANVELEDYQDLYEFITNCKKADNQYIIYKKSK